MLRKLFSIGTLGAAGLVALGVLSVQGGTALADQDAAKRDEDTPDLVLVADDDDDDTNDNGTDDTGNTNTGTNKADTRTDNTDNDTAGNSRNTRDNTNSRFTKVSRDRDLSRGDKTRDWTRDGARDGKLKRDWSANRTNDRSRNDTRR